MKRPLLLLTAFTAVVAAALAPVLVAGPPRELRVCADPNNLPFSNQQRQGFENRLAELVAREMHATVRYTWWAQRRGFVRHTLRAGECDVIMGVPSGYDPVRTTRPYYRSTYVFLYPKERGLAVRSFDDKALRSLRVGVHVIGDDYANAPPAHALSARGIVSNVVGYSIYGDYRQPNPPARVVEAVARGDVDVAIVWGPLGGYFAGRQPTPLEIVPVSPAVDPPALPFVFDIAMGVRRNDEALQRTLDGIIERKSEAIAALLARYGVPLVAPAPHTGPTAARGVAPPQPDGTWSSGTTASALPVRASARGGR